MKRCLFCAKDIDEAAAICPHCGHDPAILPNREAPYTVQKDDTPIARVRVIDIDLPFGSMVNLILKWALASIPALLILGLIGVMVVAFLAAIGATL